MSDKGFMVMADDEAAGPGNLAPWEALVVEAVGNVIGFWNFKRNQGRVWALLYLRDRPLSAGDLQEALGLSKGAASMLTRELEGWGVIHRVRTPGDAVWRFVAETGLMRMVGRVIREREAGMVRRVKADLEEAERLAKLERTIPREVVDRLARMRALANLVDSAISAFLATARLDVAEAVRVLDPSGKRRK